MYKRQAYIHASKKVAELVDTLEGDEKTGAKVILKALEAPPVSYTHLDVYKRQILRYSLWMSLYQTLMQSFVYR